MANTTNICKKVILLFIFSCFSLFPGSQSLHHKVSENITTTVKISKRGGGGSFRGGRARGGGGARGGRSSGVVPIIIYGGGGHAHIQHGNHSLASTKSGGRKKEEQERIYADHMPSCGFPAIFNFGDSNSDTGGFSALLEQIQPPNGETYFGKPAGRLSDGRLIIDFIASSLNLPFLSSYLDSLGSNFSHGANFATAGSTVRSLNTTCFVSALSPISLDVQTSQFSQFKSRSSLLYQHDDKYFSEALYTFDIGQNDITLASFLNMTTDEVKATILDIINNFKIAIQSVYGEGGRYFWIHNTGPLGCLAIVLETIPLHVDRYGCASSFNDVAKMFNQKLKDEVEQFRREFPLASFVYVDVYTVKLSLFSEGHKYGFEHPLVSCCGKGGKYNIEIPCGTTEENANGTEILKGDSCKNPSASVNWDGTHYTEAANKFVFDRISGGGFSNPPLPISLACLHSLQNFL